MKNVLFVNHAEKACGVHNYGVNVFSIISKSTKYNFIYFECSSFPALSEKVAHTSAFAVIYNYHPATAGWAVPYINTLNGRGIKQLIINHEPSTGTPAGLAGCISQDPSFVESGTDYKTVRPILPFEEKPYPERLTFSTFGFGFGNNTFSWAAKVVNEQFDDALLRINIPFAHFGDSNGAAARGWIDLIRKEITKPGIELQITHDFKATYDLINWLADSSLILFTYQYMHGRGCSSTIDFALAAKKPIAVTTSYQFKHFQEIVPEINLENNLLQSIMELGLEPTNELRERWSNANLVSDYERILDTL